MGFGIALAGGGTRGAAHVGVLLALEEAGLRPRVVAGASAGAIVGGLYAAGLPAKRLCDLVRGLQKKGKQLIDPDYLGLLRAVFQFLTFRTPTVQGLIKGERLERFLCGLTGGMTVRGTIKASGIGVLIPAVDIRTGDTVVYCSDTGAARPLPCVRWQSEALLCAAMRASASVPGIFRPKGMDGGCLVDGGITDNLPVNLLAAAGEREILAVDVSEEYTMPETENLIGVASHAFTIMSSRLKELVSTKERLLLHPELPKEAGLLTFEHMAACMEAGYDCARAELSAIRYLFG